MYKKFINREHTVHELRTMKNIFSSFERVKILQSVIFMPGEISVNNTAQQLKLSKGLVSKYLDILEKEGILKRIGGKYIVADSAIDKAIKILFNIKNIDLRPLKKYAFVRSAGLYGSCVHGENTNESDVDFWIRIDKAAEDKVAALTAELRQKIERIKILVLTESKIAKIREDDPLFYYSLAFGSIVLYGDRDSVQL